jgi:hypothetical protein
MNEFFPSPFPVQHISQLGEGCKDGRLPGMDLSRKSAIKIVSDVEDIGKESTFNIYTTNHHFYHHQRLSESTENCRQQQEKKKKKKHKKTHARVDEGW